MALNSATTAALRDWLTRRQWSQAELAAAVGTSKQRIHQILTGEGPGLQLAVRLEAVTGIPASSWVATEVKQ